MQEELSRLEPVELREIWPNEAADFTPWLAEEENLALLGETLGMDLELEGQELNVGDFHADILCRNAVDDSRVIIENQLERTDHNHLGQILTYAAGLDAHTVIWIAKEFRDEHRAALDRQNEITDERFQYFGIEVKAWQIGDSARAPQFDLVVKPNDWNRTVSKETQRAVSEDLSEGQLQRIKFWTELRDYMSENDSQLQFPTPKQYSFLAFGTGRTGFTFYGTISTQKKAIEVSLYVSGENATATLSLVEGTTSGDRERIGGVT